MQSQYGSEILFVAKASVRYRMPSPAGKKTESQSSAKAAAEELRALEARMAELKRAKGKVFYAQETDSEIQDGIKMKEHDCRTETVERASDSPKSALPASGCDPEHVCSNRLLPHP